MKQKIELYIRQHMWGYRKRNKLTQAQMAELIHVSCRNYQEQENGRCGFSAWPLFYYLEKLSDEEILDFIHGILRLVRRADELD